MMSYVLLWCWASLSHAACEPQGYHDSLAACQQAQQEAQRFDNRAIAVSGLPVLVRYHCDVDGAADEAPFAPKGAETRAGKKARHDVVHISRRHHGARKTEPAAAAQKTQTLTRQSNTTNAAPTRPLASPYPTSGPQPPLRNGSEPIAKEAHAYQDAE